MNIDHFISEAVSRSVEALYGPLGEEQLQIQKTRKEFDGDYTLVVFPLLRRSRKSPEATAAGIERRSISCASSISGARFFASSSDMPEAVSSLTWAL